MKQAGKGGHFRFKGFSLLCKKHFNPFSGIGVWESVNRGTSDVSLQRDSLNQS
jgi:hypothetical protein